MSPPLPGQSPLPAILPLLNSQSYVSLFLSLLLSRWLSNNLSLPVEIRQLWFVSSTVGIGRLVAACTYLLPTQSLLFSNFSSPLCMHLRPRTGIGSLILCPAGCQFHPLSTPFPLLFLLKKKILNVFFHLVLLSLLSLTLFIT